MKRKNHLFEALVSDGNLSRAIDEVNKTHHWRKHHRPNPVTAWVELTKPERVKELREIVESGFIPKKPRVVERYDPSARKMRIISEPAQWPDQYVHHALIQVLQPVFMRGMDNYCCGSIRGRGTHYGKRAIERWMRKDPKGTRYEFQGDIRHFYDNLKPDVVMGRMRRLVKDRKVLDLIERVIKDGISIGAYTSQWFANVTLQSLDMLIRQSGLASHYIRYMDNLTVFGPNKRKLHKLKRLVERWLAGNSLMLKGDWQVFPVRWEKPTGHGCLKKGRTPDAVGYRYGRELKGGVYTIPRKHNLIRMKRKVANYRKQVKDGKPVHPTTAAGLLSRLGQIVHCNNNNIYRMLYRDGKIVRLLKTIIRKNQRKEVLTWSMYLGQMGTPKPSEQKAVPIPA